jgi:hypothetical protein
MCLPAYTQEVQVIENECGSVNVVKQLRQHIHEEVKGKIKQSGIHQGDVWNACFLSRPRSSNISSTKDPPTHFVFMTWKARDTLGLAMLQSMMG